MSLLILCRPLASPLPRRRISLPMTAASPGDIPEPSIRSSMRANLITTACGLLVIGSEDDS
jgi:hypothetical protein